MPIGRTPGSLSSGTSRQATNPDRPSGSTREVHRRRATPARALHRSAEALLNDQQKRRHAYASTPDVPDAPCVLFAAIFIASPVIFSKMILS